MAQLYRREQQEWPEGVLKAGGWEGMLKFGKLKFKHLCINRRAKAGKVHDTPKAPRGRPRKRKPNADADEDGINRDPLAELEEMDMDDETPVSPDLRWEEQREPYEHTQRRRSKASTYVRTIISLV